MIINIYLRVVLDKHSPYRIASGKIMDVFKNTDGDYHVHILVDNEYRNLLKVDFVVIPYAWLLRIISFVLPLPIIIVYVIVSTIKPRYTVICRYTLKNSNHLTKPKLKWYHIFSDLSSYFNLLFYEDVFSSYIRNLLIHLHTLTLLTIKT